MLFLEDGATISRVTLFKFFVSVNNLSVAVLELLHCQVHLADCVEKNEICICNRFIENIKIIDPHKSITDVFMFDGVSNFQLAGELLKIHYPKITVMCGVEHTVYLFFNDFSKIPVLNQMITAHKEIYNLFGSEIYHKHHSIFKSKSYEFHSRNIGLFSGNDTKMDCYFIVMHRYLCMRKELLGTVSLVEFSTMALNSKLSKVVSYIQDNKAWERIYVLLNILPPFLCTLSIADRNKSGMDKVLYYSIMTKISIIKSSTDLDNKELFPVSGS